MQDSYQYLLFDDEITFDFEEHLNVFFDNDWLTLNSFGVARVSFLDCGNGRQKIWENKE